VKVDTFSPAYTLRDELRARDANVTLSDPYYSSDELSALGFEAAGPEGAKVVVLNTAHPQFASPNFATWRHNGVEVLLDGRNFWNQALAEQAGLLYLGIGRCARGEACGASAAAMSDAEVSVHAASSKS
jgi:UDP-N-acetyl-D-mannosaminuronate dehydrogenase